MVRANCRARFTAVDFDFIVRTLARSQTDQVSLVDLLSDVETRDSVLDHPRLVDAILNHCGHLRISSQFYFYVLARHVLQQGGIGDRKLCDYVASLLETFSRASRLQISDETHRLAEQYISDVLIALNRATPEQAFLLRAHIGNYSLFISGIFHENTQRRSLRGGPDIKFYEQLGRTNYQLVSSHAAARRCELDDVFEGLADRFRDVRLALNQLSDQLINLDDCLIDKNRCAQLSILAGKSARELSELARTFLRRAGDQLYVGIYYSRWLIEQLEEHDPRAGLGDRNIRSLIMFVEELNHALHAALQFKRGVREIASEDFVRNLELQAQVDTYLVLLLFVAFFRKTQRVSASDRRWLRFHLFARQYPEAYRDANMRGRYLETSQLAANYTRYLDALNAVRRLDEIRRFHALDYGAKRVRILTLTNGSGT